MKLSHSIPLSFKPGVLKRQNGFTLIEVLVSISIIALTIAAIYGVFSSVSSAKDRLDADSATYHRARVLFDRFGRELHGAYLSSANKDSIFTGGENSSGEIFLELSTTAASPLSSQGTGYALVRYTLVEDDEADDGSKVLLRSEKPVLSEDDDDPTDMRLIAGIQTFNLRFFSDSRWRDTWNSSTEGLPELVEIEIEIKNKDGAEVPFLSAIKLPGVSQ